MGKICFTAREQGRADTVIAAETEFSRNRVQHLFEDDRILVNGKKVKSNCKLHAGDSIELDIEEAKPLAVTAQDIPIDILYEDSGLAVINKPQGMVVHPSAGHEDGTLVNALMYHISDLSSIGGTERPGIVHRIDRMTSGLLVVAKNDRVHQSLSEQFSVHSAHREYITVAAGNFKEDSGTIDLPIGRSPNDRKKMAVVKDGKNAVSHWTVLERFGSYTLLKMRLETGRTHQIRVHLAAVNHPVAGDPVYSSGKNPFGLTGQALHGYKLQFTHPETGNAMTFYAPVPDYFLTVLKRLGSGYPLENLYKEC